MTTCRIVIHGPEETTTLSPQQCGTTEEIIVVNQQQGKISVCSNFSSSDIIIEKTSATRLSPSTAMSSSRIKLQELDLNVRKLFATMDVNGNGYITLREFERHLALCGIQLGWEAVEKLYTLIICPLAAGSANKTCSLLNRKI